MNKDPRVKNRTIYLYTTHKILLHAKYENSCSDSYLPLVSLLAGVPGKSACLLTLSDCVLLASSLLKMSSSSSSSSISSRVPSRTSRRNRLQIEISLIYDSIKWRYLVVEDFLKVLTTLTVVMVLGSCNSPYILLSRALLSSMNLSIDLAG